MRVEDYTLKLRWWQCNAPPRMQRNLKKYYQSNTACLNHRHFACISIAQTSKKSICSQQLIFSTSRAKKGLRGRAHVSDPKNPLIWRGLLPDKNKTNQRSLPSGPINHVTNSVEQFNGFWTSVSQVSKNCATTTA